MAFYVGLDFVSQLAPFMQFGVKEILVLELA